MTGNHYEILGIWRDSSEDEIEERYNLLRERLADERQLGVAGSADLLASVEEAYAVLTTPARRAAYDAALPAPASVETPAFKTYEGYGGSIELHGDHLVIRRGDGLLSRAHGLGGTREIPLVAVSGVKLKPANAMVNGYLQLQLGGDPPRDHIGDPNAITFRRKHSPEFHELAELLEKQLAANVEHGVDPTAVEVDRGSSRLDGLQAKIPLASIVIESTGTLKHAKAWKLWADRIETPDGTFPLTPDVKASVENDARREFAPAKLIALGVLGATKKRGGIWLTVEGEAFHCLGTAPVRQDRKVRDFAAKVNRAAKALSATASPEPSSITHRQLPPMRSSRFASSESCETPDC